MLKKIWNGCISDVMFPDSNHNQILMGIDIKHLPTNSMSIKAGILSLICTDAAQVVPIEMIAVIVGCIVGRLTYPFLADDTFAVPYSTIKVKTTYLCKIFHCGGYAAERMGDIVLTTVYINNGWGLHLQRLPHFLTKIISIASARCPFDNYTKNL